MDIGFEGAVGWRSKIRYGRHWLHTAGSWVYRRADRRNHVSNRCLQAQSLVVFWLLVYPARIIGFLYFQSESDRQFVLPANIRSAHNLSWSVDGRNRDQLTLEEPTPSFRSMIHSPRSK